MDTYLEQFESYIKLERYCSPLTVRAYTKEAKQFTDFIEENNEIGSVGDITLTMFRAWLVSLKETGLGNRTICRRISSVRTYFEYLVKMGYAKDNIAKLVTSPRFSALPLEAISAQDMKRWLDSEPTEPTFFETRDRLIVELFYVTGMRQAEMLSLTEESIDVSASEIRIVGKGNKERIVPISQGVLKKIEAYIDLKHAQFPFLQSLWVNSKGQTLTKKQLYNIVTEQLGGIRQHGKRSPHVLRHTFATNTLLEGADINSIKEILGHATIASTEVYTHNTIEQLKREYKKAHPKAEFKE